ncbi:MAG TPA: alkaline phosphatase [Candidatus Binatia bacterium]|nr:alkaline phosphatase [Candidatus Binatia bacterium]
MQIRSPVNVKILLVVLLVALATSTSLGQPKPAVNATPKYVFLFLSDGAGIVHLEIARQYNRQIHNEGFTITDKIVKEGVMGLMTTHAADSLSTDSAAAATAMANGCKANIGGLGMCADGTIPTSAMELARRRGMKLGVITTAAVYDSSPAAFLCHVPNRRDYPLILNRYLDLDPAVLMGGGKEQFLAKSLTGEDSSLLRAFEKSGYLHVNTKQELEKAARQKVLGLFSARDMSFELDRDKNTEPSVLDMTRATIRLLHDQSPNGFFAFIESENTDSASHLSDVAAMIQDYREFDRAVGLAYEFYRKYPRETLILVVSDHETGGLGFTQALKDLSSTRNENQIAATTADFKKIQGIKISLRKATEILGRNPTPEAVDKLMQDHFAGFTLAPEYKEAILKRRPLTRTLFTDPVAQALGAMVANNVQAYWLTSTHTNKPVLVAALGTGAERFKGYYDNADFGAKLKGLFESKNNSGRVTQLNK